MTSPLTTRLAVIASLVLCASSAAEAFQHPDYVPLQPRLLPTDWPVPGRLDYRIRDLEAGRARVSGGVSGEFHGSQSRPILLDSIQKRLSNSSRQRQLKYAEINKRLDRLEGVLTRRLQDRRTSATPVPLWTPEPHQNDEPPSPIEVPIPSTEPPVLTAPTESKPEPKEEEPVKAPPTIVTDSAIDRVALADSLFASNRLDMALRMYLELAAEKHEPEEQIWIHFQIGSASRRLRKFDQSRKHYRIVAGQKSGGLYPKLARWWLDTIQRRLAYEEKQAELQSFIVESEASNAPAR